MDFFNIHTHITKHPESEILSADVLSFSSIGKNEYLSVGIHPWYLADNDAENQLESLRKAIGNRQVVAIGECGLDKLKGPSMELQASVFRKEIALAEEHNLPMVIHCVKAYNELVQIKKSTHPQQPWIIHGFRGKEALAKECLQHGFHLSFGAYFQEDALRAVPFEKLFVEPMSREWPLKKYTFA